jgi:hypothetical protein
MRLGRTAAHNSRVVAKQEVKLNGFSCAAVGKPDVNPIWSFRRVRRSPLKFRVLQIR